MRTKRGRPRDYNKTKTVYQVCGTNDEAETLFCELVAILGYPIGKAYKIAFPDSKASSNSASPMASRLLREPQIQRYINSLYRFYSAGGLVTFNEKSIINS